MEGGGGGGEIQARICTRMIPFVLCAPAFAQTSDVVSRKRPGRRAPLGRV